MSLQGEITAVRQYLERIQKLLEDGLELRDRKRLQELLVMLKPMVLSADRRARLALSLTRDRPEPPPASHTKTLARIQTKFYEVFGDVASADEPNDIYDLRRLIESSVDAHYSAYAQRVITVLCGKEPKW